MMPEVPEVPVAILLTVHPRRGEPRSQRRTGRITASGVAIDGEPIHVDDGDRVVWSTEIPGLCGAFDVEIAPPTVH